MLQVIDVTRFRWFIIRVSPNGEGRAQRLLSRHGVCSFVPTVKARVKRTVSRGRVMQVRMRPLLEGYVFVGVQDMRAAFGAMFECGLVRGVICRASDGLPYELKAAEIVKQNLKAWELTAPMSQLAAPIPFKVGEVVRVAVGSAAGVAAPVISLDERLRRVKVELPLFGRLTLCEIPVDALAVSA